MWDAIITPEQTEQIRAKLDDPARRTIRAARRYLLAGMLRCHACDAVLVSHPRQNQHRYVCKTGHDFVGCGKTYISGPRVEELIYEAVLYRVDTPELEAALSGRASQDARVAELAAQYRRSCARARRPASARDRSGSPRAFGSRPRAGSDPRNDPPASPASG